MPGVEIGQKPHPIWTGGSALLAASSIGLGIGVGPSAVFVSSLIGIVLAAAGWWMTRRATIPAILLATHTMLIVIALVLHALFLSPLSDDSLQMPHLNAPYHDPRGLFDLRVPAGWLTEPIQVGVESGVRLRPEDRAHYMGVSELTVRVRPLGRAPKHTRKFLDDMARTVTKDAKGSGKLFTFTTRPAKLLSGDSGLWSRLTVKRFWVPLYQLALFGIKGQHYLCSVSATGLESHATLSEVLCLGVFETIRVGNKQ